MSDYFKNWNCVFLTDTHMFWVFCWQYNCIFRNRSGIFRDNISGEHILYSSDRLGVQLPHDVFHNGVAVVNV